MNINYTVKAYSLLTLIFIALIACSENKNKDIRQWTDEQIAEWYNHSYWNNEFPLKADSSIDKRLFVEQNKLNPKAWEAAYKFIKESDFNTMEPGKYELSDDGTYATIREYNTKELSHFEAHRKFIDIQIVSKGKEYVQITSLDQEGRRQVKPYDEKGDIEFFDKDNFTRHLLVPGHFMVFFPSNPHMPNMKVDSVALVRKIVVKIPYVENNNR